MYTFILASLVQYEPREKKESVPTNKSTDRPLLGVKTTKNFVSQNAIDAIMAVPRKPERNYVDARTGDKFPLDQSGLTPIYVRKKVSFSLINGAILEANRL